MANLSLRIVGEEPGLLMHNAEFLADPLHPLCKEIKKYTGKRKKTDDDHEKIAKLEWQGGLYLKEVEVNGKKAMCPILPSRVLRKSIEDAARRSKNGDKVRTGLFVEDAILDYDGPRDMDALYEDKRFVHRASIGVNNSRTMRTRPHFQKWSATVNIQYDEGVVNEQEVIEFVITAGRYVGVGDWRPSTGGGLYGKFRLDR